MSEAWELLETTALLLFYIEQEVEIVQCESSHGIREHSLCQLKATDQLKNLPFLEVPFHKSDSTIWYFLGTLNSRII